MNACTSILFRRYPVYFQETWVPLCISKELYVYHEALERPETPTIQYRVGYVGKHLPLNASCLSEMLVTWAFIWFSSRASSDQFQQYSELKRCKNKIVILGLMENRATITPWVVTVPLQVVESRYVNKHHFSRWLGCVIDEVLVKQIAFDSHLETC